MACTKKWLQLELNPRRVSREAAKATNGPPSTALLKLAAAKIERRQFSGISFFPEKEKSLQREESFEVSRSDPDYKRTRGIT